MPFTDRPLPADFEVPAIAPRKPGKYLFGPNRPSPGKAKGAVAKITRDIKNGIVEAAENIGRVDIDGGGGLVGYLEYVALKHPKAFCHLLAKLMPMQISAAVGHHISSVRVVSIPSDHYLSAQDIERARSPGIFEATAAPEPLVEPEAPAASAQEIKPYSPEEAARVAELRKLPLEELKRLAGVTDADH